MKIYWGIHGEHPFINNNCICITEGANMPTEADAVHAFIKNINSPQLSNKFFFVQVNTGKEKQKAGIPSDEADEFINYCLHDLKLNIIGLMCIPPHNDNPAPHFIMLKKLASQNHLQHLSMGMSSDYEIALKEGATLIRIGSQLFGDRQLIK